MSTLAEILDEMADQIRNVVSQVTDVDVQVEPGMLLNPSPPTIDLYPFDPSTDTETAAFGELTGGELITIRARIATADNTEGQRLLWAFMDDQDPLSIAAAVTDDPTLNGMGRIDIQSRSGYQLFPTAQGDGLHLGCRWTALVLKAYS